MKLKWLLLYIIISCVLTAGCALNSLTNQHTEEVKPTNTSNTIIDTKEEQVSAYLSITTTNKNFENIYYTYDLATQELQEVIRVQDTAQYPLGVVDRSNQVLYHADRDSKGSDQLVKVDLVTKEKEQLTDTIFAINYMIPINNKVILAAVDQKKTAVQLALYDLESKKLTYWFELDNDDTSVQTMMYEPFNRNLYVTQFSQLERKYYDEKAFEEQSDNVIPAEHYVVKYTEEGSEVQEVYRENEKIVIFSVSKEGDLALIRSAPMVFGKRELYLYNLNTGDKEKLHLSNVSYVEHAFFSPDQEGIFFSGKLGQRDNSEATPIVDGSPNGLYYYDFKTEEIHEILSKSATYINNFTLMYQADE